MKTLTIRNITIGAGVPKICVSMIGQTKKALLLEVEAILKKKDKISIAEWRMDYFEDIENIEKALEMLSILRSSLGDIILLTTFRTIQEGGVKKVEPSFYVSLNEAVCKSQLVDLIDIELLIGNEAVSFLEKLAHQYNINVMMSTHDFSQTPLKEEMIKRMKNMQKLGADILKIAVMPLCKRDVLGLLDATTQVYETCGEPLMVSIAMDEIGGITRVCGEVFASCITFGAMEQVSAPGQMRVDDVYETLSILHKYKG